MRKIIHIVGNRPQFVKLAVLYNELSKSKQIVQEILHTGQHFSYDMSELFFKELSIPSPTHNFNIQDASANVFIGKATDALQDYFSNNKNSVVFVYGDTNTTLAAALAAKRVGLPLIHFEAGVRTYDNTMPEELNRIITDKLADVNYCCTYFNKTKMIEEGLSSNKIENTIITGDLMLDAYNLIEASDKNVTNINEYIACTVHRAANLHNLQNLQIIIASLNEINTIIPILMPLHPHTAKKIAEYGLQPNFTLLPALGYPNMKTFINNSTYVITDSGGTSREAYFAHKKSLILMDQPFWPEIINKRCSINTFVKMKTIVKDFTKLESLQADFDTPIFGNGQAAQKIHQHLLNYL